MRLCKQCNAPVGKKFIFCEKCMAINKKEQRKQHNAKYNKTSKLKEQKYCKNSDCGVPVFGNRKYCCEECRGIFLSSNKEHSNSKSSRKSTKRVDTEKERAAREKERTKYDGTVDPKWLTRGNISNKTNSTGLEGSFTY
jgi:predicted nucleic acid-binding Zn ribbon protein